VSKRSRIIVLVTVAILAASVVSRFTTANSHADFLGNLQASVGPGFEIQLKTPEGALVSQLGAGSYAIHVNDSATNHNFHLEGPSVNMATGIADIQEVDWMVDFGDAYYTYHCDMHPGLTGSFAAGNVAPLPAPAPAAPVTTTLIPVPPVVSGGSSSSSSSSIPVPAVVKSRVAGTVKVTLSAKGKLTATIGGRTLTSLETGTYKLVVSDQSKKGDVTLRRVNGGKTALTSKAFTGQKTVTFDFLGGTWKLYSAANEKTAFSSFKVNG
jgi:hypothetical protein